MPKPRAISVTSNGMTSSRSSCRRTAMTTRRPRPASRWHFAGGLKSTAPAKEGNGRQQRDQGSEDE